MLGIYHYQQSKVSDRNGDAELFKQEVDPHIIFKKSVFLIYKCVNLTSQ